MTMIITYRQMTMIITYRQMTMIITIELPCVKSDNSF